MSSQTASTTARLRDGLLGIFDGTDGSTSYWNRLMLGLPLLYVALFLLLGLGYMFLISFWQVEQYTLIADWTLGNYVTVLTTYTYLYFIGKSFLTASAVTLISLCIGYPIAYYVSKRLQAHQQLGVLLTLSAPFFVGTLIRVFAHQGLIGPTGMINIALIRAGVGHIGLFDYGNFQTLVGEVYLWLPFMILSIFLSLENIDYELLEAGYDAGASPLRAFYEIVWPLSRPGVVIGSILVFVPTFTDSTVPQFVGGPSGTQIGMVIHSHFGSSGEWAFGSALSVVLVAISLAVIAALGWTIPWQAYSVGGEEQ
ncbi:MAG: ABC transporter permease [Haloferacaceae archaeon]